MLITHWSHGLDELNVVANLSVLALKGVVSVAEGWQGLLGGTQGQGNSLGKGGRGTSADRRGTISDGIHVLTQQCIAQQLDQPLLQ